MDQFEKFQDRILICVDCKEEFAFTIGAQEYFAERGFTDEPKRCRTCFADYKQKESKQRMNLGKRISGYSDVGRGDDGDIGGLLVWQPKPVGPPPRQDYDRCDFDDDKRWAK